MNIDANFREDALIKLLKAGKSISNCATLYNRLIRNLAGRLNDNFEININETPTIWQCLQFVINIFPL